MNEILYNVLMAAAVSGTLSLFYYGGKALLSFIANHNVLGNCPHCGAPLRKKDHLYKCSACSTLYHSECYKIHGCVYECEKSDG